MVKKTGDIMIPVFIHFLAGNLVILFLGTYLDSAALTGITGIAVFPAIYWMYRKEEHKKRKERQMCPWWSYPLAALLGIIANQIISFLMNLFTITDSFSNKVQESLFQSNFMVQIICLGIVSPVIEEMIFRGLVYRRLKKYLNTWVAILLGAFIFAAYHGNMLQMIFAFPMAIMIIWCYERWNSLTIPIVFHAAGNLSAVILYQSMRL